MADRSSARIGRTATVYITLGVLQRSLNLLILPFVTRLLTPAEYGLVSVVVTTVSLIGIIFASAVEAQLFRALAIGGSSGHRIVVWTRWYLVVILPAACLLLGAFVACMGFVHAPIWGLEIASAGLVATLTGYALPIARASDRLRLFVSLSVTWMAASTLGKLALMTTILPGAMGWVVGDLAAGFLGWTMVVIFVRTPRPTGETSSGSGLPRSPFHLAISCLPLIPHRLSFWALVSLSRPALAIVASASAVGLFSLAVNIASVGMTLVAELNRSVLLEYSREQFPAPSARTRSIARLQIIAAVAMPAIVGCGAALLAPVAIADPFFGALPLAGILLLGQMFYGLYVVPLNYLVQTAGLFRWSSVASVLGAVVTCLSIFLSGGRLETVAWGTVAGYATMAVLGVAVVLAHRLAIRWRELLPNALAFALSGAGICLSTYSLVGFPDLGALALVGAALALAGLAMQLRRRSPKDQLPPEVESS